MLLIGVSLLPQACSQPSLRGATQLGEERKSKLTVGAGGDLLFNNAMMTKALSSNNGYQSFFTPIQQLIQDSDLFYSNYETATAECISSDGKEVPNCPMETGDIYGFVSDNINNFPRLASDLVAVGYDVVSLTNNHIGDRGLVGVTKTKDVCDKASLPNFGARKSSADDWYTVVKKEGWNVAWVGCTGHLTHRKNSDYPSVLNCSSPEFLPLVKELSQRPDVHAVIATVHWRGETEAGGLPCGLGGDVYTTEIHKPMREFAKNIIDAGALVVLGAHPHVLMDWETHGNGIIFYSLGNMVASQAYSPNSLRSCAERLGKDESFCKRLLLSNAVVSFDLAVTGTGPAKVSCFKYTPTTWDENKEEMRMMTDSEAESSWAREVLGNRERIASKGLLCE
jgi:hypothetical protein